MNVIAFPNRKNRDAEPGPEIDVTEHQAIRDFALNIAMHLRSDDELNRRAPFLVDKVIMLLIKESRSLNQ